MSESNAEEQQKKALIKEIQLRQEIHRRRKQNKIATMFPDKGPLRRELYKKHLQFFEAGAAHRERLLLAGNRVGKTEAGAYEVALHLTGEYPTWWKGRRFARPVVAMVAGDTGQTTRDILQAKLLGGLWCSGEWGTGIIPGRALLFKPTSRPGIANAYDAVQVEHAMGMPSTLLFRSYEQGRKIFQGVELDIFWPDEEVPQEVYTEGLVRTMTTNGLVMLTFTPLQGVTPLITDFLTDASTTL